MPFIHELFEELTVFCGGLMQQRTEEAHNMLLFFMSVSNRTQNRVECVYRLNLCSIDRHYRPLCSMCFSHLNHRWLLERHQRSIPFSHGRKTNLHVYGFFTRFPSKKQQQKQIPQEQMLSRADLMHGQCISKKHEQQVIRSTHLDLCNATIPSIPR